MELLLQNLIKNMDLIHGVMIRDVAIAITDLEKYVYYKAGKEIDHNVVEGTPIKIDSLVHECIMKKKTCYNVVNSDKFGVPYVGKSVPIYSYGKIIGAVFVGENTKDIETIKEISLDLSNVINTINSSTKLINNQIEELKSYSSELNGFINNMNYDIKGISDFSKIINKIGQQTQMLGINASIESARLGDAGKGFTVVVNEIEKLSKQSKNSVLQIESTITGIINKSDKVLHGSGELNVITNDINDEIYLISKSINHLHDEIIKLNKLSLNR